MANFIEIDFIEAGEQRSGDAIAMRRGQGDFACIYVVDGGYAADGQKLIDHIREHYGPHYYIDHLVLTHPDADHATGLETVLERMHVANLWMNRPWQHVDVLMPMFKHYQNRDRLITRLRDAFEKVAELEAIARARGIEPLDAFQGSRIGEFTILSPSYWTYLQLVVESEKTPVPAPRMAGLLGRPRAPLSRSHWGEERLKGDTEGTRPDNEMSIVQFADICAIKVLLTGDAGVRALTEAHQFASRIPLVTTPLNWFQVPHHGSRRNVSPAVLDAWLGPKRTQRLQYPAFHAVISANRNDPEHPKNAVVRALIHRGGGVYQTNEVLQLRSIGAPDRGWPSAPSTDYPHEQED